jgi:hypothetical protein
MREHQLSRGASISGVTGRYVLRLDFVPPSEAKEASPHMVHLILVGSAFLVLGRIMVWMFRSDSAEAGVLAILWLVMLFWMPTWLCAVTFLSCLAWVVPGLEQAVGHRCRRLLSFKPSGSTAVLDTQATA